MHDCLAGTILRISKSEESDRLLYILADLFLILHMAGISLKARKGQCYNIIARQLACKLRFLCDHSDTARVPCNEKKVLR